MDLFNDIPSFNVLPFDGDVKYYGSIINNENSKHYFERLLNNIQWENDKAIIFGKLIITKRDSKLVSKKLSDFTLVYVL